MEGAYSIKSFYDLLNGEKYKRLFRSELVNPFWIKLEKVLLVLNNVNNLVGDINPEALNKCFHEIDNSIQDYKQNQNVESLEKLNRVTDDLLEIIYTELNNALLEYSGKISPLLQNQKNLESIIEGCKEAVKNTEQSASSTKLKFQTQFDEFIKRSKQLTRDYQDQIDADREKFKKQSDSHISEMLKFIELKKNSWDSELDKINKQKEDLEGGVNELHNKLNIATYGIQSSAYLDASKTERKLANILRIIALGLMVFVAILVAYLTFDSGNKDLDIYKIAVRFILIFSLMIPAGYASKESTKHRERSEYYRLRGMEILALEIYVSDMPKDEALTIKKTLVDKYFGVIKPEYDNQPMSGTPELTELVSKISELFKGSSNK